ncbi:MAG: hypothetical protein K2H18_01120 [Muribaculaceae bacterium]|nr:hypothetical protein [Muribaculaceae bacterium]
MIYSAEEMIRDVRVAIDMNCGEDRLAAVSDEDTLRLDELIYSKIEEAARIVLMDAPARLLESGHDLVNDDGSNFYMGDDGKGFVILPDNFLRLVSFRMSDWNRTVYEPITAADPLYARQSSRWKGICGNPERPVCALVRRSEGLVLEFFSCRDEEATVAQACYVPVPRIDQDGRIDVAEGCYRAAVYKAAALTLGSYGDQGFQVMNEMSKAMITAS